MFRPTEEEALDNVMHEQYLRHKYRDNLDLLPIEHTLLLLDRKFANRVLVSRAAGLPEKFVETVLETTAEKLEIFLIVNRPLNHILPD